MPCSTTSGCCACGRRRGVSTQRLEGRGRPVTGWRCRLTQGPAATILRYVWKRSDCEHNNVDVDVNGIVLGWLCATRGTGMRTIELLRLVLCGERLSLPVCTATARMAWDMQLHCVWLPAEVEGFSPLRSARALTAPGKAQGCVEERGGSASCRLWDMTGCSRRQITCGSRV